VLDADTPLVDIRSRRRGRRWLAAAAAAVVAAVGAAVVAIGDDPADVELGTASTTAPPVVSTLGGVAGTTACGALPFEVSLPSGFTLLDEAAMGDVLRLDYTGPTGTVSITWPGQLPPDEVEARDATGSATGGMIRAQRMEDTTGRPAFRLTATGFGLGEAPCDLVSAFVSGEDAAAAGSLAVAVQDSILAIEEAPLLRGPVVLDSDVPTVGPCESPTSPNVGAAVTGGSVHDTPEAALEAFLASRTHLVEEYGIEVERPIHPTSGYDQLHLVAGPTSTPSGIAFTHRPDPSRPAFVGTLIVVTPVGGGHAVTRWEASGC
jgi:hypothetical protein